MAKDNRNVLLNLVMMRGIMDIHHHLITATERVVAVASLIPEDEEDSLVTREPLKEALLRLSDASEQLILAMNLDRHEGLEEARDGALQEIRRSTARGLEEIG